ncbi:MAG: hypothetical protein JWN04_535 [Myxococcaceae bacterium]|nr:hypothetical protein [Myxococcaceae bacterium]
MTLPSVRDDPKRYSDVRRLLLIVTCLGLCLGPSGLWVGHARADRVVPPARIESARGIAMGSGARASASSTQAQADNPANLVQSGVYHLEAFSTYDPTFKRFGVGASVVDAITARVAAGASFRMLGGNNDAGANKGYEGRLSLGIPVIEQLSLGVSGRYSNFRLSDTHAVPERVPAEGEAEDRTFRLKHFTMDVAATLRPFPGLAISALAYNLIDTNSPLAPMQVGGSAAFSVGGFTVGGDVLVDLNKQGLFSGPKLYVGGGLEFLASGTAPLRVGYAYDQGRDQNFVTGGLGFVDQRFGAQFSLRQSVGAQRETSLYLGLQYFVQ